MKKTKRLFALTLALLCIVSVMSISASAAAPNPGYDPDATTVSTCPNCNVRSCTVTTTNETVYEQTRCAHYVNGVDVYKVTRDKTTYSCTKCGYSGTTYTNSTRSFYACQGRSDR